MLVANGDNGTPRPDEMELPLLSDPEVYKVYFYSLFAMFNYLYGIDYQLYTCFGPSLGYSLTWYEPLQGPF